LGVGPAQAIVDARLAGVGPSFEFDNRRVGFDESSDPADYLTRGFLFSDLRGYTDYVDAHGDRAAADLLDSYRRLVRDVVRRYGGAEIKTEGDSFYVVFPSASSAVRCGLAIAAAAETATREQPARPIRVAIGIHAGESAQTDDGYVGLAVNTAARICAQAQAGEVLVSETVRSIAGSGHDFTFTRRGRRRLKGIAEAVGLYAVQARAGAAEGAVQFVPRRITVSGRSWGMGLLAATVGVGIVVVGLVGSRIYSGGPTPSAPGPTSSAVASHSQVSPTPAVSVSASQAAFLPELTVTRRIRAGGINLVATTDDAVWVATGGAVYRIDPRTYRIVAGIAFDVSAVAMTGRGKDLWVALQDANQIVRIDEATNRIRSSVTVFEPYDVAATAGFVWVTARTTPRTEPVWGLQTALVRVDTKANKVAQTTDLGRAVRDVEAGSGAVWVSGGAIWHVDPNTGRIESTFNVESRPLAIGGGSVWIRGDADSIVRLDPALGRVESRIQGPAGLQELAFGEGSVWAAGSGAAPVALLQISPASNRPSSTTVLPETYGLGVGNEPTKNLAAGFNSIWVCDHTDGELWQIEPKG